MKLWVKILILGSKVLFARILSVLVLLSLIGVVLAAIPSPLSSEPNLNWGRFHYKTPELIGQNYNFY